MNLPLALSDTVLDVLCPMHLIVSGTGHVLHAGPTAQKLWPAGQLEGMRFLEAFSVKRPRAISSMKDLIKAQDRKLRLESRNAGRTSLKGILIPLDDPEGGVIVNLGFGISIIESVRNYALTNADFSATDLAIEMLYLVEAKTAAMEASRRLNLRLQGARLAAEEQADTDTLTGLKNRRALDAHLTRLIEASAHFAVMHIDLDYFKAVNDTLGHAAGDHVLQEVARIMLEETRSGDTVARVGGDEFTVVLPEVQSEEVLRRVGQRIIDRLEIPIPFEGESCQISASIGTVWVHSDPIPTMQEVLADADVALYASKHAGRAQQTLYTPELRRAANRGTSPKGKVDRIGS